MEYGIAVVLTLLCSWAIIIYIKKKNIRQYSHVIYRQSDMHNMLKYFFSLNTETTVKAKSQLTKRIEEDTIKVIVLGTQAYWVSNNTFYVAKAIGGEVLTETAKPVDVENMSKIDVEKMLFILDSLKNGKEDDRSSTGNE
jgi:hypothetical protein